MGFRIQKNWIKTLAGALEQDGPKNQCFMPGGSDSMSRIVDLAMPPDPDTSTDQHNDKSS